MSARTDLPKAKQVRTRAASRPVSMVFFFIGNPFQNFVISIIYIYIVKIFYEILTFVRDLLHNKTQLVELGFTGSDSRGRCHRQRGLPW